MKLTPAEEGDLIKQYEPFLSRMVSIYMTQAKLPTSGQRADLMQEARLALLTHIRRIESVDQIFMCHIHVISAMCRHKEQMGLLHIPHGKYEKERQKYERVGVELLNDLPADGEDVLFRVVVDAFLDTLNPSERRAFEMILEGYTNREIMREIGLKSDSQVFRYLRRLIGQYKRFTDWQEDGQ